MMSVSNCDPVPVDEVRQILRMDAFNRKTDNWSPLRRFGTVNRQAGDFGESQKCVGHEIGVVDLNGREANLGHKVDCRAERDGLGDGDRAGLELRWQPRPRRMVPKDLADHVPAAEERVHRLEQRAAAIEDSDAGRSIQLVPGER